MRKLALSFPLEAKGKKARSEPSGDGKDLTFPMTSASRVVDAECPGFLVPMHPFVPSALPTNPAWGLGERESCDLGTFAMSLSSVALVVEPSPLDAFPEKGI